MRDVFLGDICFVRRIIQDDAAFPARVVNPVLQAFLGDGGAGRVVREAKVDDVGALGRKFRREAVLRRAGHVDHVGPGARRRIIGAGTARHDIAVDVDRIDRIGDRDLVVRGEDLLDVGAVALRTIRNEDLVCFNVAASGFEIVLCDRAAQALITEVRCVSLECLLVRHLIDCAVQCIDDDRSERLGDVADAHADDFLVRIGRRELADLAADGREQVAARQFQIVVIDLIHMKFSSLFTHVHLLQRSLIPVNGYSVSGAQTDPEANVFSSPKASLRQPLINSH